MQARSDRLSSPTETHEKKENIAIFSAHNLCRLCFGAFLEKMNMGLNTVPCESQLDFNEYLEKETDFSLIVLCAIMPGDSDFLQAEALMRDYPSIPVAIHSEPVAGEVMMEFLQKGVKGYLDSDMTEEMLRAALSLILNGSAYIPPKALEQTIPEIRGLANKPVFLETAAPTRRQTQVLELIAKGMSNKQIAHTLDLAEPTVKAHVRQLMLKFGATNRTQLALLQRENGN